MREAYPVILKKCDGDAVPFYVRIPDLGISTQGEDIADAIEMARDAICEKIYSLESRNKEVPASGTAEIKMEDGEFLNYVDVNYEAFKKARVNRTVKKNCTIPQWLAEKAAAQGVNFSRVLQEALVGIVGDEVAV